jgi:hypothetical protein
MTKTVIAVLAAVAVVCSGCDNKDEGSSNPEITPEAVVLNGACTNESQLACVEDILVECAGLTWVGVKDCAGIDMKCDMNADGDADCVPKTGETIVDPPPPVVACDKNGHIASGQVGMFDDDLFGYYQIYSQEASQTGQLLNQIILIAMPGLTTGQDYSFAGANAKLETLREAALLGFDETERMYVANAGTVNFGEMGTVGGQLTALLTGVEMREVDGSSAATVDVPNGQIWCIDSLTIMAPLMRFACQLLGVTEGQTTCLSDGTNSMTVACRAGTNMLGLSELYPDTMCVPPQQCVDSTPVGTAVCE